MFIGISEKLKLSQLDSIVQDIKNFVYNFILCFPPLRNFRNYLPK